MKRRHIFFPIPRPLIFSFSFFEGVWSLFCPLVSPCNFYLFSLFLFFFIVLFFFFLFCFFFPPLPFCAFFPFCLRRFRYLFPNLDPPWAGSRCAQLLPPPSVLEQTCDSDYANPQQPQLFWQYTAQPLNPLPESDGL